MEKHLKGLHYMWRLACCSAPGLQRHRSGCTGPPAGTCEGSIDLGLTEAADDALLGELLRLSARDWRVQGSTLARRRSDLCRTW